MNALTQRLNPTWRDLITPDLSIEMLDSFLARVDNIYNIEDVLPPRETLFNAFNYFDPPQTRVVLLGQDPYHTPDRAHGLAFSVQTSSHLPPSLRNIYQELTADTGCPTPTSGDLTPWARQGVLLLNTTLTVKVGEPLSHQDIGWSLFSNAIIHQLSQTCSHLVFILWGRSAQAKLPLIDTSRHLILSSSHPSPLSARNGFFGSRPFTKTNAYLTANNIKPIDWQI